MKIEIEKLEEKLVKRAKERFGYSSHTEFVNEAILHFYNLKVDEQLEIAAKFSNEHPEEKIDTISLQVVTNA